MNVAQLKKFCAALPGAASRLLDEPMNVLVYSVDGKTFAYFKTSQPERWRFSFRASPERFIELTDVPGIKPARWLGRYRWVTVVDVRSVPAAYLRDWWSGRTARRWIRSAGNAGANCSAIPQNPLRPRVLRHVLRGRRGRAAQIAARVIADAPGAEKVAAREDDLPDPARSRSDATGRVLQTWRVEVLLRPDYNDS